MKYCCVYAILVVLSHSVQRSVLIKSVANHNDHDTSYNPTAARGMQKPEGEEKALDRLRRLCRDDVRFPYIQCRVDSATNDFLFKTGSYGAGVAADLINDPARYNVDVYAGCRVLSDLTDANLRIDIDSQHKVDQNLYSKIPVFIKTVNFSLLGESDKLEVTQTASAFSREQRRARALSGKLLAPTVYDVVRKDSNIAELSDEFYITQYLEGSPVFELFDLTASDWEAVLAPIMKTIKTALQSGDTSIAREGILKLRHEGWLRVRSFFGIVDSILGVVHRLWTLDFRHCDLHGSNIFILLETVDVGSDYFEELLLQGRGIAPLYLNGEQLSDIVALKQTLWNKGITTARFFVLHPQRLRFIDLAFLINIKELKESVPCLSGPCRTSSADRLEDVFELWRLWTRLRQIAKIMKQKWEDLRARNEFVMKKYRSLGAEIDSHINEMVDTVDQIYVQIMMRNEEWSDCQKYVLFYVIKRKPLSEGERDDLRKRWNSITKYGCTVEQEMHGLKIAQKRLYKLAQEKVEPNLPMPFSYSVVRPMDSFRYPLLPLAKILSLSALSRHGTLSRDS